jgi:hypothetical protein
LEYLSCKNGNLILAIFSLPVPTAVVGIKPLTQALSGNNIEQNSKHLQNDARIFILIKNN